MKRSGVMKSIVYEKAFDFAVRIVNLYKYLTNDRKEYVISKQVLRSGTSIGANIKEALQGQSKKDYLSKMNIALKEASETEYWLELLIATNYIDKNYSSSILQDCVEINKMLIAIVKTTKKQLKVDS